MAGGIAGMLRARGVGPETVVGISGSRSPDTVAALLGILKAGGAYVALDPGDPEERTRYILANTGVRVLLSSDCTVQTGCLTGIEEIRLPAGDGAFAERHMPTLGSGATSDSLASVIYTSGSSGRPKGVALTHRSIVSRLQGPTSYIPVEPRLQKTSFGLVGHIADLLTPLVHGWPAILIDDDTARNLPALVRAIRRHGVHRLFLVPSMLRVFLDMPEAESLRGQLHTLLVSGENLPHELAARFRRRFPEETTLIHAYGLSETAGTVCHTTIAGEAEITIGKPPPGVIEILTDELERVQPGAVGEIAVTGPSLARGYPNEPALTAERFRPNPFGKTGSRIYRAGTSDDVFPMAGFRSSDEKTARSSCTGFGSI
jgi:non-ribosomal peptide synthetase component F